MICFDWTKILQRVLVEIVT